MNNTPEHLKPFEAAARSYCAKVGVDPDATMKMPHPLVRNAVIDSPPMWHDAAERLIDLSMMLSSMKEASAAPRVLQS
jgi:hypothetical protein